MYYHISSVISASLPIIRPKKVVLFPEIGCVKIILSLTRPHMSNVYDNIFILFQKNINKKISSSKFIRTNLRFFLLNNKR